MRKKRSSRQILNVLVTLISVIAVLSAAPGTAGASGTDYVIVIDVSTSMQDIFDEVRNAAKSTLGKAKVGDNVAVITFGEQATLLDRKQIRGTADVQNIERKLDDLYPTEYATYINRGLEKGLSELRYLFDKSPDRERVLLWLSDDKDNPPEELGEDYLTLDKLREENQRFEPGNEWFAYNAPLSEVENMALEDFVTWARRTTFLVGIREANVDLGSFENGEVKKTVVLTFEPRHPGAAGLEFAAAVRLVDSEDPNRSIPVGLSPQRIVASGNPWQQQFQLTFNGEPGEYKGMFSFEPLAGSSLDVEPRSVALTAMILAPQVTPVEPIPTEEPKRDGLLADAKRSGIIATEDRPPGLTRPDKPLGFGPLDPGKKDSKIISLFLNKEADPKRITHDKSINLPEGVTIETEVFGSGTRLAAEITVSVDKEVQLPEDFLLQEAYEGSIRFKSDEAGVQVLPLTIPVRVAFNTDRVRWGRKMLPRNDMGQFRARGMTFEELTEELTRQDATEGEDTGSLGFALRRTWSRLISRNVFLPILAALVVVVIVLIYRMRPASVLFAGELVVIKDPSGSEMKNVNLKRVGSLHGKDVLTVGSGPKADIRLNHDSVSPIHCRISAKKLEDQTDMAILPIKGNSIKINDIEQSERILLSDKDLIGIGDFILLFSAPEKQKQIVAHYLDGHTERGTPVTWDIASSTFELLKTESGGSEETAEEISIIHFADLKAVFFIQEEAGVRSGMPREKINREELLDITFSDGETIEGYPLTDYSETASRFHLVPRDMPNILSILVERNSVREISRKKAPTESEETKTTGFLASLFKRKGTASAE